MINDQRVLAIIPARGGSKGLPGKNIKSMRGKPLIAHAIQAGIQNKYIDEVIVSTDCNEIANVSRSYGAKVEDRPSDLSGDKSLIADTLRMLYQKYQDFQIVVLLEPTCPLRTEDNINQCIEMLVTQNADSVATVSKSEPPLTRMWIFENQVFKPLIEGSDASKPRQEQQDAYFLNGAAYAFNFSSFSKSDSNLIFYGKKIPIVVENVLVDIDTLADFKLAESLMENLSENK